MLVLVTTWSPLKYSKERYVHIHTVMLLGADGLLQARPMLMDFIVLHQCPLHLRLAASTVRQFSLLFRQYYTPTF